MLKRKFSKGNMNGFKILKDSFLCYKRKTSLVFLMTFSFLFTQAQTLPVSDQFLQEYVRIKQLKGIVDSNLSMTVQPLNSSFMPEGDSTSIRYLPKDLANRTEKFQFKILPISLIQRFNSEHPYDWNDGLMIPSKGYLALFSGGVYSQYGPLSIQFRPELIYASNENFLEGNDKSASVSYNNYISTADIPGYYWSPDYSRIDYGQSSVRLTFDPVSLGISNENLWWGPGRKNALVMSNTARGFKHLTLNTVKPVITPIGSIEAQIIAGRLERSDDIRNLSRLDQWRYLSGMVFSYQPRWVPGLFLGLTRVFQMYHSDIQTAGDYFPLLQAFEKNKTKEGDKTRDQLTSVFARLLLPEAGAELYVEFARNDHSVDLRDFTMEPEHSRAYLAGFQKLVDLDRPGEKLLVAAEVTQLSQAPTRHVRNAGTFYTHSQILQGYTHRGEVLGAGVGPGGNIQTLDFSWLKGFKKMGIQFERYVHNNDYYQSISAGGSGQNGQWVDVSAGLLLNWDYKDLLINTKILGVQSYNYLWQSGYYGTPLKNAFNVHASLGLSYYFK